MPNNSLVKSHNRKGKIVKSFYRKNERRKNIIKGTLVAAAALAIPVTSYVVLRKRYLTNLVNYGKTLTSNPNIGKALSKDTRSITFTIGGFTGLDSQKQQLDNLGQAKIMATKLNNNLANNVTIPLKHNFKIEKIAPIDGVTKWVASSIKAATVNLTKGQNKDSQAIASEIYNYAIKNPNKQINILGYSAGGSIAKDVSVILDSAGIKNYKVVNFASGDYLRLPKRRTLEFVGSKDFANLFKNSKQIVIPNARHDLNDYLNNDNAMTKVYDYFSF